MIPREVYAVLIVLIGLELLSVTDADAVDGGWSNWSAWSICSVTCGQGQRKRYRACDNPAPNFGGKWCQGKNAQFGECVASLDCPVDGHWGEWGQWTTCSISCGQGIRHRYRACDSPVAQSSGKPCNGNSQDTEACAAVKECPRDGHWSSWSKWSKCSVTCGGGGSRLRYRSCNNPPPSGDGANCEGPMRGARKCSASVQCPINGMWSEWSQWTQCSVTCGEGERQRWRSCDNPPPQHGGQDCDRTLANEMQIDVCNASISCPVNGIWSEWGEWGSCNSPDCLSESDVSYSFRQRSCNSPVPAHGGSMCQGTFIQAGLCVQPQNCKVDGNWSSWSSWSCTSTLAKRSRRCDNPPPSNGGKTCPPNGALEWFSKDQNKDSYNNVCSDFTNDDEDMPNMSGSGDDETEEDPLLNIQD